MRKIFTTLKSVVAATVIAAMTLATSCSYDDTAIKKDVEQITTDLAALTERVAALENELDEQVASLTELINGKVVVTDVTTEGDTITVTLSDGSSFTIDNSKSTAVKGDDYTIGAYLDGGVYYWAVFKNGDFQNFLEVDGQKVAVFAEGCDCEEQAPAEGCACDLKMEVREDGFLYVSIDGGANWVSTELPAQQVSGACVFTGVEVNGDVVTFTLADGSTFDIQKAELVEFEAAKSAIYVKTAQTKSIAFAINDAVEDINVMNQPLGWKASVEAPTRAVGGMDYVLNITGPAKDFLQYAEKSGKISIHFNTAAGACKVMNIDVELAAIDLQVDKAGNITITTTVVDEYDYTDWYGETEHIVEFNNFYLAIFDLDQYNAINGDLESVYNSSWGEFNIPAAAGFINNVFANIGDNPYENATYVDGVNEKWTINATVESVLDNLDWYGQLPYEGNSFMVCVIPTDINANGAPVWAETIAVPFKQLSISIEEIVENRAFNNAYFDVTLRGGAAYYLYPASKADIDLYVNEYEYYASAEEYFWSSLESYLQYPDWYSFGFKIESDVIEQNIALSDLLAYTRDYYYFETKPATEYIMCLFVEEEGRTEYSIEDLRLFEFATADLVAAEPAYEVTYEMDEDWSLYTIGVNVTVPESIVTVYSRWYDEDMPAEDMQADLIDNGYARTEDDFVESGHTYYLGTNVDAPATTKYLGLLLIDAQGNCTVVSLPFASKDIVMSDVDFSIENVAFTPEAVTVTLAGLEGLEVKNYKYYFISTTGGSYYQKTEEECQDIAYSNDWLYKSTTGYPIIITSTADYKYSFSDGTYKLAVGVEFADGSFSKCVYGEYTYEQPAEELVSVTAAYQESDPNWYAFSFTLADGRVMTTTLGNGGVNYLNEGTYDYNNYYSSGFAIGNTYIDNTTWVGQITITVKYVDGKYDLTVNSSAGKFHYYGDIEGLIVPGYEPEEPAVPSFVELTSASAVHAASNYIGGTGYDLTFTDGTTTIVFQVQTLDKTYLREGSWNDTEYTWSDEGYINSATWTGVETAWPYAMQVAVVDGAYDISLEIVDYYAEGQPTLTAHYAGQIEGFTLPVAEEPEPEVPGDAINVEILNVTTGYDQAGEKELQFWYSATNAHVLDFKGFNACVPGQPVAAGYYSTENGGLDGTYCIFDYGTTNGKMSYAECTVTDNGSGSLTYDAKFTYNGQDYTFSYTSPAQEVEESGNTVELTSKSAGEKIGSYAYGCLLSDAEGNNQVKIAVDEYSAWDANTDFPKANAYATWQSSPSYIMQGTHFSFVNKTLKVNGVTYANDAVSNAKLTVVEATSITIEFTVDGEDYKFVYNAF